MIWLEGGDFLDSEIKEGFLEEVTQAETQLTRKNPSCENLKEGKNE